MDRNTKIDLIEKKFSSIQELVLPHLGGFLMDSVAQTMLAELIQMICDFYIEECESELLFDDEIRGLLEQWCANQKEFHDTSYPLWPIKKKYCLEISDSPGFSMGSPAPPGPGSKILMCVWYQEDGIHESDFCSVYNTIIAAFKTFCPPS